MLDRWMKRILPVVLALSMLCALFASGCALLKPASEEPAAAEAATPAPNRIPDNAVKLDLSNMELTGAEIDKLMQSQNLSSVDLRGSNMTPEQIRKLIALLPGCEVLWNVPLGDMAIDSAETAVKADASVDAAALQMALPHLTALTEMDLTDTAVSTQDVLSLMASYPNVHFLIQAEVCGVSADSGATELDLTKADGFSVEGLIAALPLFPALTSVDLTGHKLTFAEMDALTAAAPQVQYLWDVDYLGMTVHSGDEFLDLSGKTVDDPTALAQALRYMTGLKKLDMCDCGLTDEQMGALREQFPDIAINWIIRIGAWSMRTDVTAFSTGKTESSSQVTYDKSSNIKSLKTEHIEALKYCTEMVALDIGHQRIDDISVVANMKKLRFLIIADGKFTDITPIASCTQLEFLEVFQNYIADFSPLLSLTNLKCLNCGATKSPDKAAEKAAAAERLNVLKQMSGLERLWCIHAGFTKEQVTELETALPNCMICSGGAHPTAGGWRADNAYYVEMQKLFELKVLN